MRPQWSGLREPCTTLRCIGRREKTDLELIQVRIRKIRSIASAALASVHLNISKAVSPTLNFEPRNNNTLFLSVTGKKISRIRVPRNRDTFCEFENSHLVSVI